MQPRKIILKCINCGKDFEQEVKASDRAEYEKEVAWYRGTRSTVRPAGWQGWGTGMEDNRR